MTRTYLGCCTGSGGWIRRGREAGGICYSFRGGLACNLYNRGPSILDIIHWAAGLIWMWFHATVGALQGSVNIQFKYKKGGIEICYFSYFCFDLLYFSYSETHQNKPQLRRKKPNPPNKIPKELRFSTYILLFTLFPFYPK